MFIGLFIGDTGAHVTIVIRHVVQDGDQERMIAILENEVAPLLPIALQIDAETVMFGYQNNIPVKKVRFADDKTREVLQDCYARMYKQVEGHKAHPELSMHVTVDDPVRLDAIDDILINNGGQYIAMRAVLRRIGGDKAVLGEVNK